MGIKLNSPHRFRERILLFGGGGAGKTYATLTIADHLATGEMFVIDADYSAAYDRALSSDFADVEDMVHVTDVEPEWGAFIAAVEDIVNTADPEVDWLVIDPISASWDWVQEWVLAQVHGEDLTRMLIELRKANPDARDYSRARGNLMNWELVKKEYGRLWRAIQRWKGHLVLVAEAKAVRSDEKDDETKMLYGPLGFMPAGQASLKHVASTTLFMDHPRRGVWRMTTVKDRNRDEMDREEVDDFGLDYLGGVAEWEPVRRKKAE